MEARGATDTAVHVALVRSRSEPEDAVSSALLAAARFAIDRAAMDPDVFAQKALEAFAAADREASAIAVREASDEATETEGES